MVPVHAARGCRGAAVHVSGVHAVPAAPRPGRSGPGLRDLRRDRLRPRRGRGLGLARVRRPGRAPGPTERLAHLRCRRRRRAGRRVRAGPALAVRDPRPHGGGGRATRPPCCWCRCWPRSCSSPWSRSARGLRAALPMAGPAARPLDRAAGGPRRRLGRLSSASPSRWSAASCWTGWCPPPTRRSRSATGSRPRARSSRPSRTRSGGPGSLVAWDSLGREGRKFTGLGPTAADISAFTGEPALAPIRAYAGLESAESTEERANLAVADLERAGGFDRKYLVVATTTGSGWVDPAAIDTVEYMTGGDSAIVAIQYSYLPSWISYLVDQKRAREAGRALFDAVYSKWSALPQDSRPRLLVFGESLGSFGGETAFSGEQDLRNRTVRRGLRRTAELQHALPRVHRRPRLGQPGGRADLPGRPDGPVRRPPRAADRAGVRRLERAAGALPAAPVGPDRLVEPAPAADRAGLAARAAAATTCSARCAGSRSSPSGR